MASLDTLEILQKMVDIKTIKNIEHPIDKLKRLKQFADRDYDSNTVSLIDALLMIIDGLHERICKLDETVEELKKKQS